MNVDVVPQHLADKLFQLLLFPVFPRVERFHFNPVKK